MIQNRNLLVDVGKRLRHSLSACLFLSLAFLSLQNGFKMANVIAEESKGDQKEDKAVEAIISELERAIGKAFLLSEFDSPWVGFIGRRKVGLNFNELEIKQSIDIPETHPIQIYNPEETRSYLLEQALAHSGISPADHRSYENLIQLLDQYFGRYYLVKTGLPDSGRRRVFLFGLGPNGKFLGLKSFVVET